MSPGSWTARSPAGRTFLVVDGGLHHQLAASGNFGQVIRRNYPASSFDSWSHPARSKRDGLVRACREERMEATGTTTLEDVKGVLASTLGIADRADRLSAATVLFGGIPSWTPWRSWSWWPRLSSNSALLSVMTM